MAIFLKIPLEAGLSDQKLSAEISGTVYVFRVMWNELFGYWSLSLFTTDETPIILGIKMVKNYPLLGRYSRQELPAGDFYFIQENGNSERPSYEDLGTSFGLYYYEPDASVVTTESGSANQDLELGSIWDNGFSIWDGSFSVWDK